MDRRRQVMLDITIWTVALVDSVQHWRVSKEPSGSEHSQIRLSLSRMIEHFSKIIQKKRIGYQLQEIRGSTRSHRLTFRRGHQVANLERDQKDCLVQKQ